MTVTAIPASVSFFQCIFQLYDRQFLCKKLDLLFPVWSFCCFQFKPNSRTPVHPFWTVWNKSCSERQHKSEESAPNDQFCLCVMRLPTLKMSFYLKTSHRVLCLGNVYFYKPSQQLSSYFQQWGICQFAQGAISSLSLSKQIVCHRSQPETQPGLALESEHAPFTGIAAVSVLASWLKSY